MKPCFLIWAVLKSKIPTDDLLKRRNFTLASSVEEEESIDHLFVCCHWISSLWHLSLSLMGLAAFILPMLRYIDRMETKEEELDSQNLEDKASSLLGFQALSFENVDWLKPTAQLWYKGVLVFFGGGVSNKKLLFMRHQGSVTDLQKGHAQRSL